MQKVFSFGLGDECSKDLVTNAAKLGRGESYFANSDELDSLKSKVIEALQIASEPMMQNC